MSTKRSIDYNYKEKPHKIYKGNNDETIPSFHLYTDLFDDDVIYLEVEDIEFFIESLYIESKKKQQNSITMKIPVKLWNRLVSKGKQKAGLSFESMKKDFEKKKRPKNKKKNKGGKE